MISLKELTGLPVICQGRQVGQVEKAVLNHYCTALAGLVVRRGLGPAKWISAEAIQVFGDVSILSARLPSRLPPSLPPPPGPVWEPGGLRLGLVSDAYLEGLRVCALEIFLGPVDDWRFGRMIARTFALRHDGPAPKVLIPLAALERKEELHEPW